MSDRRASPASRNGSRSGRFLALAAALALCACQAGPGKPLRLAVEADSSVATLQRINEAAADCWHKSGDRAFADLRTIPELDTSAGTPRLLVVRANDAQGLPRLVIQASGEDPVTVRTYGPLVTTSTGARINRDVARWAKGSHACSPST